MADFYSENHTAGMAYQRGFATRLSTEALSGALDSAIRDPHALKIELIDGSVSPKRRSVLYKTKHSGRQQPYAEIDPRLWRSAPFREVGASPNNLLWKPFLMPLGSTDFVDGMATLGGCGDVHARTGMAIHIFRTNRDMTDRYFCDDDGELLIIPQAGSLFLATEMGCLELGVGEAGIIPRGLRFSVSLPKSSAMGFVCENYGRTFRPPQSALDRRPDDFLVPVAALENKLGPMEFITKFDGSLWTTELAQSPLNVVAWEGDLAPCKFAFRNDGNRSKIALTSLSESEDRSFLDLVFGQGEIERTVGDVFRAHSTAAAAFAGSISPNDNSIGACLIQKHSREDDTSTVGTATPQTERAFFAILSEQIIRPTRFALSTPVFQQT